MIEKMKSLIRQKDTCVLATVFENNPHCSLMSYVTDADCRELYMVTHRETKKYRNLLNNPCVSLLIDTRTDASKNPREVISALTIGGTFQKIDDEMKKERARAALLARHPALREFLTDPDAEIIAVRCRSFQLLEGIRDSYFISLS